MKKLCLLMMLIIFDYLYINPPLHSLIPIIVKGTPLIEVNGNNLDYELKLDLTELGHSMNKEMDKNQYFDTKVVQDYINSHIKLYADSEKWKERLKNLMLK